MQLINQLINQSSNYLIVPGTRSDRARYQIPDRARYQIVPGTRSLWTLGFAAILGYPCLNSVISDYLFI